MVLCCQINIGLFKMLLMIIILDSMSQISKTFSTICCSDNATPCLERASELMGSWFYSRENSEKELPDLFQHYDQLPGSGFLFPPVLYFF